MTRIMGRRGGEVNLASFDANQSQLKVGCELATEVRMVSRLNVDVANSGQVYFDGAMKYVACSHGCDKKE